LHRVYKFTPLKVITLQVFLLVDEGTVKKYKADLSDEIEPQITELVSRAEKGLEALQKKRLLLQTKVTPASSRTAVRPVLSVWNQVKTAQSKAQQPSTSDATNRRVQVLAKQRERLEAQARQLEAEILAMASLNLS
jgi:DASH complex subunit SPC19